MRDATWSPQVVSGPALVSTQNLSFGSGSDVLLKDVSVRIERDRRTCLLGSNGAGKSLLLRIVHGLLKPNSGAIAWRDGPLDASARRSQALVFQRPVLLRRSVEANLFFALRVRGIRGRVARDRVEEALNRAGLSHLARRPARVLSGGEQQRLAIARSLLSEPELLLLDEPTASLDPAATAAIEEQILDAHERGTSVLMVTHDIGQARRLAQDVVFLERGTVAETGPADQVLWTPRSAAAQAWVDGRLYLPARDEIHRK